MQFIKKVLDFLTISEQKKAFGVMLLILFTSFMDILGVASILPFIAVLANPEMINTNPLFEYVYQLSNIIGVSNITQFLFFLGVIVFVLLLMSLFLRALSQYAQLRFALMREFSIGKNLIEKYLHQPYAWFLNQHSAELGKSILSEVSAVVQQTILSILMFFAYSTLAISMILLLFVVDVKLAFIVSTFLIIVYGLVFYFMKNILTMIGDQKIKANEERFKIVSEAFSAIKEIKLAGLEKNYVELFSKPAEIFARNQALSQTISYLPRFIIEGVAFGGMIILVLVLILRGEFFFEIAPILALYAFAGYRLIPAIQNIYFSITQIRFSKPSLDLLHQNLIKLKKIENNNRNIAINFKKNICLKNVDFYYPFTKEPSLKNINFNISSFSRIGIIGPSGSGKTTLVNIILGLYSATKGSLLVDNKIISNENVKSWQKNIGYVPQQIYLSDKSIAENIAFGEEKENIDFNMIQKVSKIAKIHDFVINNLPEKYDSYIGEGGVKLSGGQRQRIGIARALYYNPNLLILDEATSSLDNETENAVVDDINKLEKNITIIMIAHRLTTLKNCEQIYLLENNEISAKGNYSEFIKNIKN